MGHVAIDIDEDLHGRARALQVRTKLKWSEWVEQAIAEKVERDEATQAERRRRTR